MAVFHPPANRVAIRAVVSEISHHAVVCLIADCVTHAIGRGKVHVGDPHCEAIIRRYTIDGLHLVPFDVMGAATVDDFVEIHWDLQSSGQLCANVCFDLIQRSSGEPILAGSHGKRYMPSMTLRPILIHPDPRLKKVADPVAEVSKEIRKQADDMIETMYDAPGIGLAAPQIGILNRLLVMDAQRDPEAKPNPMVLINPEVIWESDEKNVYEEGCLSIPDQFAEVERPKMVRVRWLDLDGKAVEEEYDNLWATCVQHEIDHLNGTLFIDYLKPLKRQMITRKMQKLKRELARG